LRGTWTAISFPYGFATALLVTAAVTAAACAAGAWFARPAGLAAIPLGLASWSVIGAAVVVAGLSLGHAHLTGWGIMLLIAVAAGLAGLPLAAAPAVTQRSFVGAGWPPCRVTLTRERCPRPAAGRDSSTPAADRPHCPAPARAA